MTSGNESKASLIASLPASERRKFLNQFKTASELEALFYDWAGFMARPSQVMPAGDWKIWLCLAGRGWGKTRVGAETVRYIAENELAERIALIAPTAKDARDVMVEGDSGILACCPEDDRPLWQPSKKRLTWKNGVQAFTYSADEPERLRGPQHGFGWLDEAAAYRRGTETWDNYQFGLRLGDMPRTIVTTTPKPVPIVLELIADKDTYVTKGSTYENEDNLAKSFLARMDKKYRGTRLGRQELYAEVLTDTPGALWTRAMIDDNRVQGHPDIFKVVVAVDPSVTNTEDSDECGIIVAGLGADDHGYILDDLSCHDTPAGWAQRAVNAARKYNADYIVAEVNNGGDLVETVIHSIDRTIQVHKVRAAQGKFTRAEPVAALYEQGLIHHVGLEPDQIRIFDILEHQMTTFVPRMLKKSPDRMDALVWALTWLFISGEQSGGVVILNPSMYRVRINDF